jgi:polyisoprenoid-binding protein YceI
MRNYHAVITKVRGVFEGVTGTIEFEEDYPTRSSVVATIPPATVDTGMEVRDNHLRSPDFLGAEQFPTLGFRSTGIEPAGNGYAITGDLTIRGVTRPVTLQAEFLGAVRNMQGVRHAGFEASTKIKRSDWGLTWNVGLESGGWLVSDEITIELEVAADEVAAVAAGEGAAAGVA